MLTYHVTRRDGQVVHVTTCPADELTYTTTGTETVYIKGAAAMTVHITPNDRGNPPGKLADVELHFTEGPLEGLKLIGFSIWQKRGTPVGRNVTFPARQYSVNGERRTFALLRPIVDMGAQAKLREIILDAYAEWEAQVAVAR